MKYKVGDIVRVKSREWYDNLTEKELNDLYFTRESAENFCGKFVKIRNMYKYCNNVYLYEIGENGLVVGEDVFEGLAEENTGESTNQCLKGLDAEESDGRYFMWGKKRVDIKEYLENMPVSNKWDLIDDSEVLPTTTGQIGGDHYTMPIMPVDFIYANNIPFIEGNIIKYVCRYKRKNGKEDLLKAKNYLEILIEKEYGI